MLEEENMCQISKCWSSVFSFELSHTALDLGLSEYLFFTWKRSEVLYNSQTVSDFRMSKPSPRGSIVLSSSIFRNLNEKKKSVFVLSLHIFENFCIKFCGFLGMGMGEPPSSISDFEIKLMGGVVISLTGTGSSQRVTGMESRSPVDASGQHRRPAP